jgi:hypothetical protein
MIFLCCNSVVFLLLRSIFQGSWMKDLTGQNAHYWSYFPNRILLKCILIGTYGGSCSFGDSHITTPNEFDRKGHECWLLSIHSLRSVVSGKQDRLASRRKASMSWGLIGPKQSLRILEANIVPYEKTIPVQSRDVSEFSQAELITT